MNFLGINLDKNKRLSCELVKVFGLGRVSVNYLLGRLGLSQHVLVGKVTETQFRLLSRFVSVHYLCGSSLGRYVSKCRKEKVLLRNYQGFRFSHNLPVRGQNTKTNAETSGKLNKVY